MEEAAAAAEGKKEIAHSMEASLSRAGVVERNSIASGVRPASKMRRGREQIGRREERRRDVRQDSKAAMGMMVLTYDAQVFHRVF
jgi:hypothetical protein